MRLTLGAWALGLLLPFAVAPGSHSSASASLPRLPCGDDNETLCGDGGPATKARLLRPTAVAADVRGFLVADTGNDAIRRVLPNGTITTVAGLGTPGYSGDGGRGAFAQLNAPSDVSSVAGGALLIADAGNGVIRRLSPGGVITTVAGAAPGAPSKPPSRSPTPATDVHLANPQGVAAVPGGGFLIADTAQNLVLKVSTDGLLSVVAGTGVPGAIGDGRPAVFARLNQPTRVLPTADGGFLILDLGNQRVRRVSPGGTIRTVPGSATSTNDFGVPFNPGGLAADADGQVFVISEKQVVRVSTNGAATTVAGTGECGSSGDGGSALAAKLAHPAGLALTPSGDLLIADMNNQGSAMGNVRRVSTSSLSITTVAGQGNQSPGCVAAGGSPTGSLWPIFYITAPRGARPYRAIRIEFASSRAAMVRTSLVKNGRRVRTNNQSAKAGSNAVTLTPGVGPGTYTMRISGTVDLPNNNPDAGGTLHVPRSFRAPLRVG